MITVHGKIMSTLLLEVASVIFLDIDFVVYVNYAIR